MNIIIKITGKNKVRMLNESPKIVDIKIDDIPAMPFIVTKLISLLADPDVSTKTLSNIIAGDSAITSKILQVANSPFFGCSKKINSLSEAIVIMGFNAIKSIVITYSTRKVFKREGLLEHLLWDHSIGAAIASNLIAKTTKKAKPEEAFIGGLLHDIGKDVMNNFNRPKYEEVMKRVYNEQVDFIEVENEIFGFSHLEAGLLAVLKWKLSQLFEIVVQYHHNNEEIKEMKEISEEDKNFLSIVSLGNLFCIKKGIGRKKEKEGFNIADLPPAQDLGLKEASIENLLLQFENLYQDEKGLFN